MMENVNTNHGAVQKKGPSEFIIKVSGSKSSLTQTCLNQND